jgi:hypothetical protein
MRILTANLLKLNNRNLEKPSGNFSWQKRDQSGKQETEIV